MFGFAPTSTGLCPRPVHRLWRSQGSPPHSMRKRGTPCLIVVAPDNARHAVAQSDAHWVRIVTDPSQPFPKKARRLAAAGPITLDGHRHPWLHRASILAQPSSSWNKYPVSSDTFGEATRLRQKVDSSSNISNIVISNRTKLAAPEIILVFTFTKSPKLSRETKELCIWTPRPLLHNHGAYEESFMSVDGCGSI